MQRIQKENDYDELHIRFTDIDINGNDIIKPKGRKIQFMIFLINNNTTGISTYRNDKRIYVYILLFHFFFINFVLR